MAKIQEKIRELINLSQELIELQRQARMRVLVIMFELFKNDALIKVIEFG